MDYGGNEHIDTFIFKAVQKGLENLRQHSHLAD
jgi:hypothetical protein